MSATNTPSKMLGLINNFDRYHSHLPELFLENYVQILKMKTPDFLVFQWYHIPILMELWLPAKNPKSPLA